MRKEDVLEYHSTAPPGKISVTPTKPCLTQRDLSLAYTPGVAVPCLEIHRDPNLAYRYTARGNLVAVVTNGSAVLGLGNIGPLASKPVMEGKAVLFKRFADIDVFDLELAASEPRDVIHACQMLEPTFGAINLEDIKAPDCFEIEEELRRTLQIPVFHDDQHGTSIIVGAGLLNALILVNKNIGDVVAVCNGAGAASLACAEHAVSLGLRRENVIMCDKEGVVYQGRSVEMNRYKARFAIATTARTLADAMKGADIFIGLSVADCVTPEMLLSMAPRPIVFALANPDPEVPYDVIVRTRPDAIVATGRSDFPNQVNNLLGFPFIFRGALDVRASTINDAMKLAATHALAELAREEVPESVSRTYGVHHLEFGPRYIIPKPFDARVLLRESMAVARAAMDSGVAREPLDLCEYRVQLERRLSKVQGVMRIVIQKAQAMPRKVVFPEGEEIKILRAAQILVDEKIAVPVLLGREGLIRERLAELRINADSVSIVDPVSAAAGPRYAEYLYQLRQRKGITQKEADELIVDHNYFASVMLATGDADALVGGLMQHYPDTIRPALEVIPMRAEVAKVSGLYVMITAGGVYFLADTTVNIDPSAEDLAEIAVLAAEMAERFDVKPRVAMLSFSNFGSTRHPHSDRMRKATELVKRRAPDLMVDGEMQADTAITPGIIEQTYPFSSLKGGANVLVFPNLEAGNIAYKLLARIGGAEAVGPVLMGLSKPVHVLQRGAEVNEIVNVSAIAVVDAQEADRRAGFWPLAPL
jgi:malate dehydrogenase (oxaloacetate-decarboxylating)(NADP+)